MSGSGLSQGIILAASPIITRIYSPAEFGLFANYTSFFIVLALISNLRYEQAIVLPKSQIESVRLLIFCFILSITAIILYTLGLLSFSRFEWAASNDLFKTKIIYLLPASLIFLVVFSLMNQMIVRNEKYSLFSINGIINSSALSIGQISFGLLGFGVFGLIFGNIFSNLCSSLFYASKLYPLKAVEWLKKAWNWDKITVSAKKYIEFPKYVLFSELAYTTSQYFMPVVLLGFYGPVVAGFYALANRITRLPLIVIGNSFANVFKIEANKQYIELGHCRPIFKSTFKKIIAVVFIPFVLLAILSPYLFGWVFGEDWSEAGQYVRVLSIMMVFEFVFLPYKFIFYIFKRQKVLMWLQITLIVLSFVGVYIGYHTFDDVYMSLLGYSIAATLVFITLIIVSYSTSKGTHEKA